MLCWTCENRVPEAVGEPRKFSSPKVECGLPWGTLKGLPV